MPPKEVEVTLNGKKVKGFIVEKTKKRKRKLLGKGKTFEWDEEYIQFYIPVSLRGRKWLLIPLGQSH